MLSLYLRTAAVLAAVALIFLGNGRGILFFMPVLAVYLLACALLSALSLWRQDPPAQQLNWAILDAVFVTAVLYQHILGAPVAQPHGLTTASLASPAHLAHVLTEYRQLVAGTVFAFGGTVDKFIGDGVMAVFGQPAARDDDAERALCCALELCDRLQAWQPFRTVDYATFQAGIGVHNGMVIGGVLDSGSHDEFTVFGDAVNVAQRLESLNKELGATLVVSFALLARTPRARGSGGWLFKKGVALTGRRIPINIAYRPRHLKTAGSSNEVNAVTPLPSSSMLRSDA